MTPLAPPLLTLYIDSTGGAMRILILFLVYMMAGCGAIYQVRSQQLLANATDADYGPVPPANHAEFEMRLLATMLKDPYSAMVQVGQPVHNVIPTAPASPNPVLVWSTYVSVNAKNGYGGYTGAQWYSFNWRDGRIIAVSLPYIIYTPDGLPADKWYLQ